MGKKLVLIYGFGEETEALSEVLLAHRMQPRVVREDEVDESIGALCGLQGYREKGKHTGGEAPGAALVFYGLSREELDKILPAIRQAGIVTSSLKAMVTDHNKGWPLRHLIGEIGKEREYMTALMDLKRFRNTVTNPNFLDVRLMTALFQVDRLTSGKVEAELKDIFQARKNLEDALKASK